MSDVTNTAGFTHPDGIHAEGCTCRWCVKRRESMSDDTLEALTDAADEDRNTATYWRERYVLLKEHLEAESERKDVVIEAAEADNLGKECAFFGDESNKHICAACNVTNTCQALAALDKPCSTDVDRFRLHEDDDGLVDDVVLHNATVHIEDLGDSVFIGVRTAAGHYHLEATSPCRIMAIPDCGGDGQ